MNASLLQNPRATRITLAPLTVLAAILVMALSGHARAAILYNTTGMVNNGTYNGAAQTHIGGQTVTPDGSPWDVQVADDFVLSSAYNITSVTSDYISTSDQVPAGGVLIEIFGDVGGHPTELAVASVLASGATLTTSTFPENLFGAFGLRFTVDLSGAGITLLPGTWWLSATPIDDNVNGAGYFQPRLNGQLTGLVSHARNGGVDHGNGYGGGYPSSNWEQFGIDFGAPEENGDFSMRIEGTLVPVPGALALVGLAGLVGRSRRRRM
jgi:MYXO-CTERM domain-containing protein